MGRHAIAGQNIIGFHTPFFLPVKGRVRSFTANLHLMVFALAPLPSHAASATALHPKRAEMLQGYFSS
jgi:hypothetical protein